MQENIAVDIQQVTKEYGTGNAAVTAVNNVTLQIYDNEFLTLLGPSGCGKTTLLRMIAGFEDMTKGHINLFGEDRGSAAQQATSKHGLSALRPVSASQRL